MIGEGNGATMFELVQGELLKGLDTSVGENEQPLVIDFQLVASKIDSEIAYSID